MAIKVADVNVALEELLNRTAQLVPHVWECHGWQTTFLSTAPDRIRMSKIDASYQFKVGDTVKIYQGVGNHGLSVVITAIEEESDHVAALVNTTLIDSAYGGVIQRMIDGATWTKPPNARFVEITAIARGGIGGGAGGNATTPGYGGGGGGAGERASAVLLADWVPDTLTVTIGVPTATGPDTDPGVLIEELDLELKPGESGGYGETSAPGAGGGLGGDGGNPSDTANGGNDGGAQNAFARGGYGGDTVVDVNATPGEGGHGWGAGGGGAGHHYADPVGKTAGGAGGGGEGGLPGPVGLKAWAPGASFVPVIPYPYQTLGAPGYVRIITWCGRDLRSS